MLTRSLHRGIQDTRNFWRGDPKGKSLVQKRNTPAASWLLEPAARYMAPGTQASIDDVIRRIETRLEDPATDRFDAERLRQEAGGLDPYWVGTPPAQPSSDSP